jgi:CheY-like chemotaxis protein
LYNDEKKRVLLVEDDPLVRTVTRLALESLGYTIVGVASVLVPPSYPQDQVMRAISLLASPALVVLTVKPITAVKEGRPE